MLRESLLSGAHDLRLQLDGAQIEKFERYAEELDTYGKNVNLTAISGEDEIAKLHFLDSLSVAMAVPLRDRSMIDVGSGAGFPGLPLRLIERSLKLTLLDSVGKKVDFLRYLCGKLDIDDVVCLHARAEELSQQPEYRETYDYAVSRAVAQLNMLAELCLPFVRPGGLFIAMKTPEAAERELAEAADAIGTLGGKPDGHFDYELGGITRRLVLIRKTGPTPKQYPRRFSRIKSNPL